MRSKLISKGKMREKTHVVSGDMSLELGSIDPGHKVFHISRDEESGIVDRIGTHSHVALLNVSDSLRKIARKPKRSAVRKRGSLKKR